MTPTTYLIRGLQEIALPDATITQKMVDSFTPVHDRTSCSDTDTSYNGYGGWDGKYDPNTGAKKIKYPRCMRCYLLNHLNESVSDLEFRILVNVDLVWKGEKENV